MTDRTRPIEALYPRLDTVHSSLQFETLTIVDGPLSYGALREVIAGRLHLLPRRRRRLHPVPMRLNRPVWVDDTDFDIDYHVRGVALPGAGTGDELKRLLGTLVAERLDLERPPWRIWVVEGLEGGRSAVLRKAHHVLWDGISERKALEIDSDPTAEVRRFTAPPWQPAPPPPTGELVAQALRDRRDDLRALRPGRRSPTGTGRPPAAERLRDAAAALRKPPRTPLNVTIGTQRRVDWVAFTNRDFRTVRRAFGGTTNDIALSVIAGALRRWMQARGEPVPDEPLRVACPVATKTAQDPGAIGNFGQGPMLADLPVHEPDPVRRLELVRTFTQKVKQSRRGPGGDVLGLVPGSLIAAGLRGLLKRGLVNLVVSNVPGPRRPIYFAGHRVTDLVGFAFPLDHLALFVIATTYDGHVTLGLNSDWQAVRDLDVIATLLRESMRELVSAAERTPAAVEARD